MHSPIFSNMNISETSRLIKLHPVLHLDGGRGGGEAALCFGPDEIRILVSMATLETTLAPLF